MAEQVIEPVGPERVVPTVTTVAATSLRLSWGAIFGGTVVAVGTSILLYTLGLALGLSTINPDNPEVSKAMGIGAGIWGLLVPIVSLFLGGLVAARTAGIIDRGLGGLHGAVLWGLTAIITLYVAGAAIAGLVGGVVNVGGKVISAGGG